MRELKNRLKTIESLVPIGARVADIGTDHGHLPISLVRGKIASEVIACDINEKPLKNAKENIEKTGTENIELRLGDGLAPIKPDEVDCIVIAGMGGEVIAGILDSCPFIKDKSYTLLLQPMTSADLLRKYLCQNGFSIVSETAVAEGKRIYTVIKATFGGEKTDFSEAFYLCGKLDPKDETARLYIEKQQKIVLKTLNDLKTNNMDYAHYEELYKEISKILGE